MNLSEILSGGKYQWVGNSSASVKDISDLVAWSQTPLPEDYLGLLLISDGGHGSLGGYPSYLRIWSARIMIESNQDYGIQQWAPGFVGLGDDGGEVIIGFDTRNGLPYSIRAIPFVPMEWSSSIDVAGDFKDLVGRILPSE